MGKKLHKRQKASEGYFTLNWLHKNAKKLSKITIIGGPYTGPHTEGKTLLWKTYGPRYTPRYKFWYGNLCISHDIGIGISLG